MGKFKEKLRVVCCVVSLFFICIAIWINRDKYCSDEDDYDLYDR
jgi:hypothetical protein